MLMLQPGQVDIWLTFSDQIQDKNLLHQYRQMLTDEERNKRKKFIFDHDRHQYLVTRALLRTVLSKYAPIRPEQWSFSTTRYGKPVIENRMPLTQKIFFNISHTRGLIILGISTSGFIGVDAEDINATEPLTDGLSQLFSAQEINDLSTADCRQYRRKFFEYWTLKEAYIKARGEGLGIPLNYISFNLRDNTPFNVSFHPLWDDRPTHWHFWQFSIFSNYLFAICMKCKEEVAQITIRNIIPLQFEDSFDATLLRKC